MKISSYMTVVGIAGLMLILTACTQMSSPSTTAPLPAAITGAVSIDTPDSPSPSSGIVMSTGAISLSGVHLASGSTAVMPPPAHVSSGVTVVSSDEDSDDRVLQMIPSRGARISVANQVSFQFPFFAPSQAYFFSEQKDRVDIYARTSDPQYAHQTIGGEKQVVHLFSVQKVQHRVLQSVCEEQKELPKNCRDDDILARLGGDDVLVFEQGSDDSDHIDTLLRIFGSQGSASVKDSIARTLIRK